MGTSHSALYVTTERTLFRPGETVVGCVHLNCVEPIPCVEITIKVSWILLFRRCSSLTSLLSLFIMSDYVLFSMCSTSMCQTTTYTHSSVHSIRLIVTRITYT